MTKYETTKNTLQQLINIINQGNWKDIKQLEDEDNRYSIALDKALLLIEELEELKAIGTVEELKALKEKSEPKKHESINVNTCCFYNNSERDWDFAK